MKQPYYWQILIAMFGGNVPDITDVCIVVETRKCGCGKHDVYELEGYYMASGFDPECFAILPEADADEMNDADREAIVPNPFLQDATPITLEDEALQAYMQVYNLTGCENRAAAAYYQTLNVPMP
jgi:hypothetical protein